MPHDPRFGPDPDSLHPLPDHPRVTFIRNLDLPPNVEVGAYTYYDDPAGPQAFLEDILYHFAFLGDRLRIGRFCAIAAGTRFLMNGGNHRLDAPSTYPFAIFGGAWAGRFPDETAFPNRDDPAGRQHRHRRRGGGENRGHPRRAALRHRGRQSSRHRADAGAAGGGGAVVGPGVVGLDA